VPNSRSPWSSSVSEGCSPRRPPAAESPTTKTGPAVPWSVPLARVGGHAPAEPGVGDQHDVPRPVPRGDSLLEGGERRAHLAERGALRPFSAECVSNPPRLTAYTWVGTEDSMQEATMSSCAASSTVFFDPICAGSTRWNAPATENRSPVPARGPRVGRRRRLPDVHGHEVAVVRVRVRVADTAHDGGLLVLPELVHARQGRVQTQAVAEVEHPGLEYDKPGHEWAAVPLHCGPPAHQLSTTRSAAGCAARTARVASLRATLSAQCRRCDRPTPSATDSGARTA
jgi:hypothetical protein